MPLSPTWHDVALRLVLTVLAAAIIGIDRSVRGHAAGLRTTILVGLAACVAMIQANILLGVDGKSASSFSVMDVMRLPLGILTGVGFIGGGTILRRGDLVTGVTTAATLWAVTIIGLCFGGDQIGLGIAASAIGFTTLWALKWLDNNIPRERHAILVIETEDTRGLADLIAPLGYRAELLGQSRIEQSEQTKFEVFWKRREREASPVDLLDTVGQTYRIVTFELIAESSN